MKTQPLATPVLTVPRSLGTVSRSRLEPPGDLPKEWWPRCGCPFLSDRNELTDNVTCNMKLYLMTLVAVVLLTGPRVVAQNESPAAPAPRLSLAAVEVLKLSHGQVGDSLILTYISTRRTTCALSVPELIYLKQQGVTEAVLAAMLRHAPAGTESAPLPDPQPAPAAVPSTALAQTAAGPAAAAPPAPIYAAPPTTYVASAPTYVVPATTYLVASPAPTYYYYPSGYHYCYPSRYYYPYYRCSWPSVSLSFGFGWGYRGGYCGGWRWVGCRGGRR